MAQLGFDLKRLPQAKICAYVENRGEACAFCGHDRLARGNFEFFDSPDGRSLEAWAEVWCPRCKETVIEVYRLADLAGETPPKGKEAYLKAGGLECPHCGSDDIWKGNVALNVREGGGWQIECEVWCPNVECWSNWNEVYRLAEVHDPVVGKNDEASDGMEYMVGYGGRTATQEEA